ncbi:MAG TPA: hypothetical protein VMT30_03960 [Candidatus Saccharimonadia bacterium]|nr:hypothetical protein [Candidatus Saccharimonadia bacterium]
MGSRTSIVQEGSIDGWWSTPDQGTCRFHLVPDVGPGAKHWSDAQRGDICQGGQPHSYIIRKDANGVLKLEVADRR